MARANNKFIYPVAGLLFLAAFAIFLWKSVGEESVYFVNVSEALAVEAESGLTQARLFGQVAPRGVSRHDDGMGVAFILKDKDDPAKSIRVDYSGAVPDTFEPGVEVIVEGSMNRDRGVFEAATLMTKCPSKYKEMREDEKQAS